MANNYKFKGVALATTDETALLTAANPQLQKVSRARTLERTL